MRKRLLILTGVVLAVAVIAGGALELLRPSPPRFTEDLAARIHPGMTEAEVVAVLGRPPGNYASPHTTDFGNTMGYWLEPEGWLLPSGNVHKGWISDAGAVCVEFGQDGLVVRSFWGPVWVWRPESPLESVGRMLRGLFGEPPAIPAIPFKKCVARPARGLFDPRFSSTGPAEAIPGRALHRPRGFRARGLVDQPPGRSSWRGADTAVRLLD
jgi:hypothetical protein